MNAASFRFRPASRLLLGREYAAVFAQRRVVRNGCFELHYRPLAEVISVSDDTATDSAGSPQTECSGRKPSPRLGLVIPKRNAKRAVHRNLIKRLAREAFRHVCGELPAYDMVLRLSKPLHPLPDGVCRNERRVWRTQIDALFLRLRRTASPG